MRTPRFEIFEGKNNEFFFRLKAKNGKIILQSEGYTAKHNAEHCINLLQTHGSILIDKKVGYELEETWGWNGTNYFFRLKSLGNGEIIGKSETYTSKAGAKKGIEAVKRCAQIAEIVDLTKD